MCLKSAALPRYQDEANQDFDGIKVPEVGSMEAEPEIKRSTSDSDNKERREFRHREDNFDQLERPLPKMTSKSEKMTSPEMTSEYEDSTKMTSENVKYLYTRQNTLSVDSRHILWPIIQKNNANNHCANIVPSVSNGQLYSVMTCRDHVKSGCRFSFGQPSCMEIIEIRFGKPVLTGCKCRRAIKRKL